MHYEEITWSGHRSQTGIRTRTFLLSNWSQYRKLRSSTALKTVYDKQTNIVEGIIPIVCEHQIVLLVYPITKACVYSLVLNDKDIMHGHNQEPRRRRVCANTELNIFQASNHHSWCQQESSQSTGRRVISLMVDMGSYTFLVCFYNVWLICWLRGKVITFVSFRQNDLSECHQYIYSIGTRYKIITPT